MDREAPDRGSASHTGMWFGPRPGSLVSLAPFLGARPPRGAPGHARLSLPAIVNPSATPTGARAAPADDPPARFVLVACLS